MGPPSSPPAERRATTSRAVARLEWLAIGLLVSLFCWKGIVPAWLRLNSDFQNYYLAGRLFRDGYPLDRANDVVWFERQKGHAGILAGVGRNIPLSPFSALFIAPFARLSPLEAKHCWLLIDVSLLAATLALLCAMTQLPIRRVFLIAFLTVVPLRTNFQFGQQYVALLFLLTLATWLHSRGRRFASGAILAISAVVKLYPVLFASFLVLKRRGSALAGLGVTLALLAVVGVALFGPATWHAYATSVLPRSGAGEANNPYWIGCNTPTIFLRRLFVAEPDLNPSPLVDAPAVYVLLQPCVAALLAVPACWLTTLARRADEALEKTARERLEWGAFVALLVILSPTSTTYLLCVLILTTVVTVDFLRRAKRSCAAALLVGLHTLFCAPIYRFVPVSPSGWRIFLGAPRLYVLLAYWGVVLWTLARVPARVRLRWGEAAALATAFGVMVIFGAWSNARHFDGLLESSASRVSVKHGADMSTSPAAGARGIYFARMGAEAFVLDRAGEGLVTHAPPGTDLFHPAVPAGGQEGWIELSSDRSRIARFRLDAPVVDAAELPVDVEDGEQPAISADGRWLAFLREERGRGGLWVADRGHADPSAPRPFVERELVDTTHDVFDFSFFPDGRIVLAARQGLGFALFTISPLGGVLDKLAVSEGPTRYPAVSPDGKRLAFGRQEHGAWQLQVLDFATHAERRLTHADCNSISPSWEPDSRTIVYATDCGRDVADTALSRIVAW